jgi:leucyl/phenylalanyl-tRNA--protein transferase
VARGAIPLDLLLRAYRNGAFPMAETADDAEVGWVQPHVRAILPLHPFRMPSRLARTVRRSDWTVTTDRAFPKVIQACAEATAARPDTWINGAISDAYVALHEAGMAHSVEVWSDSTLVGGLYGLRMGGAFFGESMFSRATDASKVALVHLVGRLVRSGFVLLDAQFENPHLDQFGAAAVPHEAYMEMLDAAVALTPDLDLFHAPMTGAEAVDQPRHPTTQAS